MIPAVGEALKDLGLHVGSALIDRSKDHTTVFVAQPLKELLPFLWILDVLHLIGFGPYIANYPYGQPEPVPFPSYVVIQDPVAGGYILVLFGETASAQSLERITGLPSPNAIVLDEAEQQAFRTQNCSSVN